MGPIVFANNEGPRIPKEKADERRVRDDVVEVADFLTAGKKPQYKVTWKDSVDFYACIFYIWKVLRFL